MSPRLLTALTFVAVLLGASLPLFLAQGAPRPGIDPGPWDNDVLLYRSWPDRSSERVAVFERSGVPALVRLSDGRLMAAQQWFPDGRVRLYFTTNRARTFDQDRPWIASAISSDGSAASFIALQGADPGVVENPDGSRLLLATGPPRPGTPSAGRLSRRPPR